jgi:hypothetical protein
MQSRDFYVSSAASALMRGASAAPRSAAPVTFTSRVVSRAPAFMPASVREARLYVPAAKEEKSWMEGFLKDLAAVRGVACGAPPARSQRRKAPKRPGSRPRIGAPPRDSDATGRRRTPRTARARTLARSGASAGAREARPPLPP